MSVCCITHIQDMTARIVAYKVDDKINGGDKAQKAFKPGYDVTQDPFYQVRQARIYKHTHKHTNTHTLNTHTLNTHTPIKQHQDGVEVPALRDDYEICKRFEGADPSLEVCIGKRVCVCVC